MWMMTDKGFFSVVRTEDGKLQARARERAHLAALQAAHPALAKLPLLRTDRADYRWRMVAPAEALVAAMAKEVEAINYGNFKDHCEKVAPGNRTLYVDALHAVWSIMRRLQRP